MDSDRKRKYGTKIEHDWAASAPSLTFHSHVRGNFLHIFCKYEIFILVSPLYAVRLEASPYFLAILSQNDSHTKLPLVPRQFHLKMQL